MGFAENFIQSFVAGKQLIRQQQEMEERMEARKLEKEMLQHRIRAMGLQDKMTARGLAKENFDFMSGLPQANWNKTAPGEVERLSSQAGQVSTPIPGMVPEAGMAQQVDTRPNMIMPGIEEFGVGPVPMGKPPTLEEGLLRERQAAIDKAMWTPRVVDDALVMPGMAENGGVLYQAPPRPKAPPTPGSFEHFLGASPDQREVITTAKKQFNAGDPKEDPSAPRANDAQLVQAIIKTPGMFTGMSPTTKERLIPQLLAAGFTGFEGSVDAKPSTGAQKRSLSFFNRAQQAEQELSRIEGTTGMSTLGQAWATYAPNFMQTQEGQAYNAAQRAFTEARLRKDSGAAIPEHEFTNDRRTYFRQPGDTDETLKQKDRMRAAVLAAIAFEAGPALYEFYGEDAKGMVEAFKQRAAQPAAGGSAATTPGDGSIQVGGFTVRVKK